MPPSSAGVESFCELSSVELADAAPRELVEDVHFAGSGGAVQGLLDVGAQLGQRGGGATSRQDDRGADALTQPLVGHPEHGAVRNRGMRCERGYTEQLPDLAVWLKSSAPPVALIAESTVRNVRT